METPTTDIAAHEAAAAERWRELEAERLPRIIPLMDARRRKIDAKHKPRLMNIIGSPRSISAKIEQLWALADELTAELKPFAACRKGCSHCCHTSVILPQQEAELIGKKIGRKPKQLTNREYRREKRELLSGYGSPCPFLKNDACSIYAARPLACRQQLNFDKDALLCELTVVSKVPYLDARAYNEALGMMTAPHRDKFDTVDGETTLRRELLEPPVTGDIREFFPQGAQR